MSDTCLLLAYLASPSTSGIRSLLIIELAGLARLGKRNSFGGWSQQGGNRFPLLYVRDH